MIFSKYSGFRVDRADGTNSHKSLIWGLHHTQEQLITFKLFVCRGRWLYNPLSTELRFTCMFQGSAAAREPVGSKHCKKYHLSRPQWMEGSPSFEAHGFSL